MPKHNKGDSLVTLARESLEKTLNELGIPIKAIHEMTHGNDSDPDFELEVGSEPTRRILVTVKARLSEKQVAEVRELSRQGKPEIKEGILFLFVPRLTKMTKEMLKESNVNHADMSGAIHIRAPGMVVEAAGNESVGHWSPVQANVNPFSDKASLILRVLLRDARRSWRITELADETKVTKGWASVVAKELESLKYATRSKSGIRITKPAEALLDWTVAYSWRRNQVHSYRSAFDRREILPHLSKLIAQGQAKCALTLLIASDFLAPHVQHDQVHLYVSVENFARFEKDARQRLFLEPVKEGGNFHLIQPYYERSVFFDVETPDGLPIVAPIQLYLDLINYPVRGHEAAGILARARLKDRLNLSAGDLKSLL